MARISNTSAYPNIVAPTTTDYLVLTDKSDNLVTKSCTLGDLQNLFGVDTLVAHVQVNSAEQLLLSTTPKELIAAPGANKVIDIMDAAIYVDDHICVLLGLGVPCILRRRANSWRFVGLR